jgi:regulator of RNase E activity RraA
MALNSTATSTKIIGPAATLKFIPKSPSPTQLLSLPSTLPADDPRAIPQGAHWVDLTPSGHVVVIESVENGVAANVGGIMALKMSLNGVRASVVSGRVRDQAEIRGIDSMGVWAGGKSSVATGAEAKVWGRQCEIRVGGVKVMPGDVVVCDGDEGCVVVIPIELVADVVRVIGDGVAKDDRVIEAVKGGMSVKDAFAKFR